MLRFIALRLVAGLSLLFAVSILVFLLVQLMPGSVAEIMLDRAATPETVAALEAELGLTDPLVLQYGRWLLGVLRGDWGVSFQNKRPVAQLLGDKMPVTLALTIGGLVVTVLVGLPLGIVAGVRPRSLSDRLATLLATLGQAIPGFWLGLLLMSLFAVQLRWFPILGYRPWRSDPVAWFYGLVLPWLALGLPTSAVVIRQTRAAIQEVLETDYVRAARAGGATGVSLLWRHVLRNALLPVITVVGLRVPVLVGGAIVVEQVFALPGLGALTVNGVLSQDIPVIQGIVLFTAVVVVFTNLLVDVSYHWLNPKVRLV